MKLQLFPLLLILATTAHPRWTTIAPAHAADASEAVTPAAAAPVLVQAHQSFIKVTGPRFTGSVTWTIAIVDPDAAEGAPAPPDLEGAKARGAEIRDGRLRLPPGLTSGTVLTFKADLKSGRSPFRASGVFRTVSGLPTARAELVVRGASGPLSVWNDRGAIPTFTNGRSPEARLIWTDIDPDGGAEAVWTASPGWDDAGVALERAVQPMLTEKIGRALGQGLEHLTPARAAERVFQQIKLVPGPDTGWTGRPARYAIEGGSGTRAERGAALISLLRAAGYDARPGLYRPSSLPGSVPTSLAAPSLLMRPVVAVILPDRVDWIDPGADATLPPELPVDMTGAVAWMTGDLPRNLGQSGAAEGSVPMSGEVRLETDGGESFTLNMTATGTADQWLRERLRGLSDAERADLFRPLVAQGRPELDRLTVSVTGLGESADAMRISIRGHAAGRMGRIARGIVSDEVPPILAPGLASWLPPRINVHEEVAVTPPPGLRLFTTAASRPPTHPGAVVSSTIRREADKIVVITDVERPQRHLPPTVAARADQVLSEAAASGSELLYVEMPTARTARAAGQANLDTADRTALQAMVWWRIARYGKARKQLAKVVAPVGLAELDAALVRYDAPYELRRSLADLPTSNQDKLASIPILVEQGRQEDAWIRAAEVATDRRPELRIRARLFMLDLQPEARPDPETSPEAAARWVDPQQLLDEADEASKRGDGRSDPRVLARRAARAMAAGQPEQAVVWLETAVALSDDPALAVALAAASAAAGAPLDAVDAQLQAAVERASSSPDVLAQVSDAYAKAGQREAALEHALAAARLEPRQDAHWERLVDRAMEAGHLSTALFAARKASDLALSDKRAASRLTRIATLAGDEANATLGWNRGGTPLDVSWPAELNTLIGLIDSNHLLALLRHHDTAVVRDPGLLSLRAELELDSGDRERAVRDGSLLTARHGMARGEVVAFGARLGQAWGSNDARVLNRLAQADIAGRSIRVEMMALFGAGANEQRILARDLGTMRDDPRAKLWKQLGTDPTGLAARDADWAAGPPPRGGAPRGYAPNPTLSGVPGVSAWTASESRQTLLRHTGKSPLPPPLSVLYTPSEPPLRSLPGAGRVFLLKDGAFNVYAAVRQEGPEWLVGLGTSVENAARALESAPPL